MVSNYLSEGPRREEIDSYKTPLVLEFGADWCGHCKAAQPLMDEVLAESMIEHIRIEDGKGKRLGRSFQVKLWPTFIFLKEGKEVARAVRPVTANELRNGINLVKNAS